MTGKDSQKIRDRQVFSAKTCNMSIISFGDCDTFTDEKPRNEGLLLGKNDVNSIFFEKSCRKIWLIEKKSVPLHPQIRNGWFRSSTE
jgi:hypothetical protein